MRRSAMGRAVGRGTASQGTGQGRAGRGTAGRGTAGRGTGNRGGPALVLIVAGLLALTGCAAHPAGTPGASGTPGSTGASPVTGTAGATLTASPPGSSAPASDPVVAAAGDIACDPSEPGFNGGAGVAGQCRQRATSDLVLGIRPAAVLTLGDHQYSDNSLDKFRQSYDPSWGRFKSITHPAIGNHEYETPRAAGYFSYFGAAAGDPTRGYYSYDIGTWHLIALNSECDFVSKGCGAGSPQEVWLKADLAAHPNRCTLAYWHQPRFSSGEHGNNTDYTPFWQALYNAGADLVLNGHDHDYERFALQDPGGQADSARGVREFVVGTGGKDHYDVVTVRPNSEVRNNVTFGVLTLTLHPTGYDWHFVAEQGKTFTDSGTASCH